MKGNKNPYISIECVVLTYNLKHLQVLLMRRKLAGQPYKNDHAVDFMLIGDQIFDNEVLEEAAYRIVTEKTGMKNLSAEQFFTTSRPDRSDNDRDRYWLVFHGLDPEIRIISVAYLILLNFNDLKSENNDNDLSWHSLDDLPRLAFDHRETILKAREYLCSKIRLGPVAYKLIPKKFSLSQLQAFYELIFGIRFDKRNFRKKVVKLKYLIPLDEKETNVTHKPARLYMFSHEVYEMTKKEFFEFPK